MIIVIVLTAAFLVGYGVYTKPQKRALVLYISISVVSFLLFILYYLFETRGMLLEQIMIYP